MNVMEFLLHQTTVGELCVIREKGWVCVAVYIDHEDLFSIPERFRDLPVKGDSWGTLGITDKYLNKVSVPCHYIDV